MKNGFVLVVFVFSYFFYTQGMSLSLLPFGEEQEKQRYIFRTLKSIEKQPVWVYGDIEEYDCTEDEIDQSIDSAFSERGLNPELDPLGWKNPPASTSLKIHITLNGETVIIEVGLFSEALLLESQVFVPAILWQEKVILNIERENPETKQNILKHAKMLVGHFLDEYLYAKKMYSTNMD
ncbi:MAG: hypothetical protein WA347_02645 [Rhabdochlamydiaceae bacterium]